MGHADSRMTLDVYAQLEERVDRSHGTSFDRLVRQARNQLRDVSIDSKEDLIGPGLGQEALDMPVQGETRHRSGKGESPAKRGFFKNGEGENRTHDTTIFSFKKKRKERPGRPTLDARSLLKNHQFLDRYIPVSLPSNNPGWKQFL
jgi:hypothetical protein